MSKTYIRANPNPWKPADTIRPTPTFWEKTHPAGSAERHLYDAGAEALKYAGAGGGAVAGGAVLKNAAKAFARRMATASVRGVMAPEEYPDPMLREAARLPEAERAVMAARWGAHASIVNAAKDAIARNMGTATVTLEPALYAFEGPALQEGVEEMKGTRQAAKGGDDRFANARNFLATDRVPDTIFGIPVAKAEGEWTEEDLKFFKEHPEAGGYYSMGDEGFDTSVQ